MWSNKISIPVIVKVSVLGYFPLQSISSSPMSEFGHPVL